MRRPHDRVGRDVGEPVVERESSVLRVEPRCEVHEAGQRREAAEPPSASTAHSEGEPSTERVRTARVGLEEDQHRLREDERNVTFEPVLEPNALAGDRVARLRDVHEDLVAVDADGEATQLVRELVERPARLEVEARVVPVAREDSVAHGSAMQRETHVRTAVVDRVHVVPVGEEADDVSVVVDHKPPGLAQFRERSDGDKGSAATSVTVMLPR